MPQGNNKKNNDSKNGGLTIKEASQQLDISESTVKKYLKDFDLEIEKGSGSKAIISQETFQALSEISKLRANGLSIQEIKELKTQKPSKHILDEIEETQESNEKEPEQKKSSENIAGDIQSIVTGEDLITKEKNGSEPDLALDIEKSEEEKELNAESEDLKDIQQEEVQEEGGRRRRLFNYRYVERQIANDSKRISSIRLRLRNPNISVQEKLFFEEALERRILFLDGWKHILRWISK